MRSVLFGSSQATKDLRALDEENRRLRQELKTTKSQLVKAETIIDVQNGLCAAWRQRPDRVRAEKMQMETTLSAAMSVFEACRHLAVPRATYYRSRPSKAPQAKKPVATDGGSRMNEGTKILEVLNSERSWDLPPTRSERHCWMKAALNATSARSYRILH